MSPTDDRLAIPDHDTLPEFELEYIWDDPDDPSKVTVFSTENNNPETEWLMADQDTVVPLSDVP